MPAEVMNSHVGDENGDFLSSTLRRKLGSERNMTGGSPRMVAATQRELRFAGCALLVMAALLGPGAASPPSPSPADRVLERLRQQERYAAAMDHAVATLRLRAARSGAMDPATLDALEQAGRTACEAGEYATAESLLQAALDAYRGTLGSDDPRLSTPLIALGRVARIKGQRELAWKLYEDARRLLERAGPQ